MIPAAETPTFIRVEDIKEAGLYWVRLDGRQGSEQPVVMQVSLEPGPRGGPYIVGISGGELQPVRGVQGFATRILVPHGWPQLQTVYIEAKRDLDFAIAMLRKLEWSVPVSTGDHGTVPTCPICGGWNPRSLAEEGWKDIELRRGHVNACQMQVLLLQRGACG